MKLEDAEQGWPIVGLESELVAVGTWSDGDLLDRFVLERDEAAFAALVTRHGAMVWGVCRRVVGDHHAAEDAFQAVFLVLARRAGSVRPRDRVGAWLHGVAQRTAIRARSTEARQRSREAPTSDLGAQPDRSAVSTDFDLLPRLDREVGRLPSKYRLPVVLCELEGLSYREAADRLGWPVGTVSGRLTRARSLLAGRLRRPEIANLGLVATLRVAVGSVVPPLPLLASTARLARLVVLGGWTKAEVIPARSLTLMRGVLFMMTLDRIRLGAVLTMGLALTVGGLGLTLRAGAAPLQEPAAKANGPGSRPTTAKTLLADQMPSYSFRFDADNIREFPELAIRTTDLQQGSLSIQTGPVTVVPMVTDVGITGVVLLGRGTYDFASKGKQIEQGTFQPLAMLRFHPSELAKLVSLDKGQKVTDKGALEACLLATPPLVRHCWQSNSRTPSGDRKQELLIPPAGEAVAAVLLTRDHGDLLISVGKPKNLVHSFTERKTLFEAEAGPGFQ